MRSLVQEQPSAVLYANDVERNGVDFFCLACDQDLEGVVAKFKHRSYGEKWFKVRNPRYSQTKAVRSYLRRNVRRAVPLVGTAGRVELFDLSRGRGDQ